MEKLKFQIVLEGVYQTEPPRARVILNNDIIFDATLTSESFIPFQREFENETNNKLEIELVDKKTEHTQIDEHGNIIKDSVLKIKKVLIEDIEIQNTFSLNKDKFYYEHSGEQHQLYDTLGINGKAVINFSTPFYVWLLETI